MHGRLLVCFVAIGLILPVARAELPPFAYKEMQAAAAEVLTIRVIFATVKTAETPTALITAVVAKAEVLAVARSATRLSPGATIQIRYTTRTEKRPMAGPSPVSVLSDGERCSAFLSKATDGDSYQPAAGGRTFESVR